VFPGDYSDDDKVTTITSTNNSTSATATVASPSSLSSSDVSAMGKETHSTKQPPPPYVMASMKYLVILTLMALAGNSSSPEDILQHQHIDKIKTGRSFPRLVSAPAISSNGKGVVKRSEFKMPSLSLIESHVTVNGRRGTAEKSPPHCPPQNTTTAQVYLTSHANDTLRVIGEEDTVTSVTTVSSVDLVPHSIIVPTISLPRREELEMLLIETCKLLAALIQPIPSEVSLRALVHLEVKLRQCLIAYCITDSGASLFIISCSLYYRQC
jgi:hypothetical protein